MEKMDLVEVARGAIDDVFSDTSVTPEETLDRLRDLAGEIEECILAIEDDLRRSEEDGK